MEALGIIVGLVISVAGLLLQAYQSSLRQKEARRHHEELEQVLSEITRPDSGLRVPVTLSELFLSILIIAVLVVAGFKWFVGRADGQTRAYGTPPGIQLLSTYYGQLLVLNPEHGMRLFNDGTGVVSERGSPTKIRWQLIAGVEFCYRDMSLPLREHCQPVRIDKGKLGLRFLPANSSTSGKLATALEPGFWRMASQGE